MAAFGGEAELVGVDRPDAAASPNAVQVEENVFHAIRFDFFEGTKGTHGARKRKPLRGDLRFLD